MTDQEAFDIVTQHLLTQRCRAQDDDGGCRYRAANGYKCAVGILIPDDEYSHRLEGRGIDDVVNRKLLPNSLRNVNPALLHDLQAVHDGNPVGQWRRQLERVAKVWGLAFNPPAEEDVCGGVP